MKGSGSPSYDIISNIPTNIKEKILSYLPIRDAVRTSIISRNWRYCWINLTKLVFDETLWEELTARQPLFSKNQFVYIIFQLALLHQGPILDFTLSVSLLGSCYEVDQLIFFLSKKNVERLTLHVGDQYKLPSSFFTFPKLVSLNLSSCVFNPPASFNGFSLLKSVSFSDVTISAEILESFISSSPLLESLVLSTPASFDYFNINSLRLKYLHIRGHMKSVFFKNAPLLTEVSIALHHQSLIVEQITQLGRSNFNEMFVYLPHLKKLELDYYMAQLLSAGDVLKKLSTTSNKLSFLKLDEICFVKLDELSFVLCLIKASPELQNIEIQMHGASSAIVPSCVLEFLEEQDYSDVSLDHLQLVTIQCLSGLQPELEFIKLLLTKSPTLEKMFIEYKPDEFTDNGLKMLKDLIRFERASPKAQIIFEDTIPS